ncbi:glycosyltransferase family 20 protein [Pisolithus marmoratus]|nr:glycosyltransferase family 20 protein [Pisolithus marmoratus]
MEDTTPGTFLSTHTCNGGLKNAIDTLGTLGSNTDGFGSVMCKNINKRMGDIFEFEGCYDEFCHQGSIQVLWPCLQHAVSAVPETKCFDEGASFKQYKSVDQCFADIIVKNYCEGDMMCNSLLQGVLSADLVGFQTANYARHFRQTGIQVKGPVAPISTGGEAEKEWNDSVEGRKGKVKGHFMDVGVFLMGMKLIVGWDELNEIQGVCHQLEAFEHFLKANLEFQGKVVLIQVALQITESNELVGSISDVMACINTAFSMLTYQPVIFLHVQEVTFSQYLTLLTIGDAFMVMSFYVECQEERNRALILSEVTTVFDGEQFMGMYSYSGFQSCFTVNPYDMHGTAKAIYQACILCSFGGTFTYLALTMSDEEATPHWQDLHNHHASLSTNLSLVPSLDLPCLIPKYRHSTSCLIFVDLEGCLWVWDMYLQECNDGDVLESMADDPKNKIWVLSGLPVKGALERLAGRIARVGIVAENGCFVKTREISNKSSGQSNGVRWVNMVANLDFAWKGPCVEILNYFTKWMPGSFVKEHATSVVWCFWTGPPDSTAPSMTMPLPLPMTFVLLP